MYVATVLLNSNLTLACVSLASTHKFSNTTRKLDASTGTSLEELMTHDTREKITRVECSSEVIACENHETVDQTRIW